VRSNRQGWHCWPRQPATPGRAPACTAGRSRSRRLRIRLPAQRPRQGGPAGAAAAAAGAGARLHELQQPAAQRGLLGLGPVARGEAVRQEAVRLGHAHLRVHRV